MSGDELAWFLIGVAVGLMLHEDPAPCPDPPQVHRLGYLEQTMEADSE